MISKTQMQFVQSLQQKKFRQRYGMFIAGGDKVVRELLASSWNANNIYALPSWIELNKDLLNQNPDICEAVSPKELERLSFQEHPNDVLAVVNFPKNQAKIEKQGWVLALDGIRDPGNMGTLLRTADWFGAAGVCASPDCVDRFNPKVVQAAMGSLFRVPFQVQPPDEFLMEDGRLLFGADARGKELKEVTFPPDGILVIGNESRGLSLAVQQKINTSVRIGGSGSAESLNATIAAGILLAKALGFT